MHSETPLSNLKACEALRLTWRRPSRYSWQAGAWQLIGEVTGQSAKSTFAGDDYFAVYINPNENDATPGGLQRLVSG